MSVTRTIIGHAIARGLLALLDAGGSPSRCETGGISATARRTKGGTLFVRLYAQGTHTYTMRRYSAERYIHARDELDSVDRFVTAAWLEVRRDAWLHDARESIYLLAESRDIPDTWFDSPPLPNPMDYEQMAPEDCAAWRPLLEALPLKSDPHEQGGCT